VHAGGWKYKSIMSQAANDKASTQVDPSTPKHTHTHPATHTWALTALSKVYSKLDIAQTACLPQLVSPNF